MKAKWRGKWMVALASGKYKQATGTFCRRDTVNGKSQVTEYCCLAVLAAEMYPGEDISKYEKDGMLNSKALRKAGLTAREQEVFACMNDGGAHKGLRLLKHTFMDIQSYIRQNIKAV